jgi:hypothetical protein
VATAQSNDSNEEDSIDRAGRIETRAESLQLEAHEERVVAGIAVVARAAGG